jgi:hypothetical protein
MIYEIDDDFYCSIAGAVDCPEIGDCIKSHCPDCHRKHPTPEQFRREYGYEYAESGAVYVFFHGNWEMDNYYHAKRTYIRYPIVCAATPIGKPEDNWRPE